MPRCWHAVGSMPSSSIGSSATAAPPRSRARGSMAGAADKTVKRALATAERICRERGVRLTETRRRVLEVIREAGRPVGAYGLLAQLSGHPMPPTVYRAIDFLLAQKFIHRIESLN